MIEPHNILLNEREEVEEEARVLVEEVSPLLLYISCYFL